MAYGAVPQGTKAKDVTITSYMKSRPFVRGFTEAQNGMRFAADITVGEVGEVTRYERGRQFGSIFKGWLKRGSEINSGAVLAFTQALQSKAII